MADLARQAVAGAGCHAADGVGCAGRHLAAQHGGIPAVVRTFPDCFWIVAIGLVGPFPRPWTCDFFFSGKLDNHIARSAYGDFIFIKITYFNMSANGITRCGERIKISSTIVWFAFPGSCAVESGAVVIDLETGDEVELPPIHLERYKEPKVPRND